MNSTEIAMPPLGSAAGMLRRTTERLARELVQPSKSAPDWTEMEWAIARAAAAMQGISALLANRLEWSGPSSWQEFLTEQSRQSRLRDEAIGLSLERIDASLRSFGIGALALKGSALRKLGLYASGERPMSDIDLLVDPADRTAIGRVLASMDYVAAYSTRRHDIYAPRVASETSVCGEHIDNPIKVEVHSLVAEALPVRVVDITGQLRSAPGEPGLRGYPDPGALMLHVLLHAAGNMRANALRQIQLHDIALLAGVLREGDWHTLFVDPTSGERRWWLYPPLALTDRYHSACIPRWVLREAGTMCPRLLRFAMQRKQLTDVSWSNLRIPAFPGIAWSRTVSEALQFIRSRLLPGSKELSELELMVKASPHLQQLSWYGISHGKRILKWVFSRPPRVQTMLSLRAAFDDNSRSDPGLAS